MSFDSAARAIFAGLADVLIPAADGMPSASQADVAGRWLDAILDARPDLTEGLSDVLAKARHRDPIGVMTDLRANDPAAFEVLAEIVPATYFMNPAVRQAIGYDGQGPQPIDPRPDYMEDGLLESVIRRGPVYRSTPERTL
jgi:hypothetical protein